MRALPRATASPAFTTDVLRKVRQTRTTAPRFVWRFAAAFAMVVCLVGVVQVSVLQREHQQQRMRAMRAEQQQIQAELAAVRKLATEAEPVVVLENDNGGRLIVDLDTAVQPASQRTFD